MPIVNADIAAVFDEIADLLEVQGGNAFRIRAYRNAARLLSELGPSVKEKLDRGEPLDELPGIGADLAGKIAEIVARGTCAQLEELRSHSPPGITQLLQLPGLGPKRVQLLNAALGIGTLEQLHEAAAAGRIREVKGFSAASEAKLLEAVGSRLNQARRFGIAVATQVSQALLDELKGAPGVQQVAAAGSLRRRRETVGDLDLVVAAKGDAVMDRFTASSQVRTVLSKGPTRSSVVLASGMQVDLRSVDAASFGAAWLYFTGSKAHNIALRRIAQDHGLKLNEYGLYRGARRIAGETEAGIYKALGLPWIEPELREDRGEIDAAMAHRLPTLVDRADILGDLHVHTSDSDGRDSLEVMALAAKARGLRYIAITDHSPRLALAHGLDASRLSRQLDAIDALNERLDGFTVLKGVEADILEDGKLDVSPKLLQRLDLVIGAVHSQFDLPRDKQTARVLRAMDHACFTILAHPSGRLLGERAGCDLDMERVVAHARERGCFLELNSHPARLDLDDIACRMAKDQGVLVSIATDSHNTLEFANLDYGVGQARRGWLEARNVLNTRKLPQLRALLDAAMGRSVVKRHAAHA